MASSIRIRISGRPAAIRVLMRSLPRIRCAPFRHHPAPIVIRERHRRPARGRIHHLARQLVPHIIAEGRRADNAVVGLNYPPTDEANDKSGSSGCEDLLRPYRAMIV